MQTDGQTSPAQTRFPWLVSALTLLVIGLLTFALLPRDTAYSVDANTYLGGAISFAHGEGYHSGTQLNHPRVTIYPPLHSLYLSLAWRMNSAFPANIFWLNLAMVLLSLGTCACLLVLLHRMSLPMPVIVLLTLTLGLSPSWLTLQTFLFSDVLLTLLASLHWLLWWREDKPAGPSTYWLTGLLLALSLLTRTAALAWIGATGLILLWKHRSTRPWHWVALLLLPFLAALWWRQWCAGGYGYGTYFQTTIQQPGGLAQYLTNTLGQAWRYLGGEYALEMLSPAFARLGSGQFTQNLPKAVVLLLKTANVTCALGLVTLAVIGCCTRWDRRSPGLLIVLGVYLAELIIWPFPLGYRVLLPLLPVLLYWIWRGYLTISQRWLTVRQVNTVATCLLTLNLLLNGMLAVRLQKGYAQPEKLADTKELAKWITRHTSAHSRIAIDDKTPLTHLHYFTGRRFIGGDAGYSPWFRPEMQVEYLITGISEESWILPPGEVARVVYQSPGGYFRIYHFMSAAN
jgi:hypothetical protein